MTANNLPAGDRLYIWLDGDPGVTPADMTIPDEPGINDNDQIAEAIARGDLGRYLPVTLRFADHPTPTPKRVRSLDVARLLRDRHIRHRRRYEIMPGEQSSPDDNPDR
jgi:hypothetical protein